mgnify:CR=1 FL=1
MKLRNFMYATMIACAFASCSNDDEIPNPGTDPVAGGDAVLAIRVAGLNQTKSASFADGKTDASIQSLHVYVFNAAGALETVGEATSTTLATNEILQTSVTAGAKKVIVIANHSKENPATVDALCSTSLTYGANEYNGNLSMNSQVYDLTIQAGKTNCLGYADADITGDRVQAVTTTGGTTVTTSPVPLYRNVAKVKVASIAMKTGWEMKYPNATFELDSVFILHARNTSTLATVTPWGATATDGSLNGIPNERYTDWVAKMLGKDKIKNYMTGGYSLYTAGVLGDAKNGTAASNSSLAKVDSFYVYENAVKAMPVAADTTLLVVSGKFLPEGESTANKDAIETSYYTVAVGIDGNPSVTPLNSTSGRTEFKGVLRNMEYQISLTIAGPGYETPFGPKQEDQTFLDVQCVVVEFGIVNQPVEI